jgi:hypothetical protein
VVGGRRRESAVSGERGGEMKSSRSCQRFRLHSTDDGRKTTAGAEAADESLVTRPSSWILLCSVHSCAPCSSGSGLAPGPPVGQTAARCANNRFALPCPVGGAATRATTRRSADCRLPTATCKAAMRAACLSGRGSRATAGRGRGAAYLLPPPPQAGVNFEAELSNEASRGPLSNSIDLVARPPRPRRRSCSRCSQQQT